MANPLGDFDTSAVIYGKFVSVRVDTGAPATLSGTPALSVYKDNSTTQSTTGVTLTADFDAVTGLNHFAIDTSADGTFYSAGSFFDIVITTGTVNSVSAVGYCVGQFTLRKNSALKPATAGRTLVVDASGLADANTVKLGPTGSGTAQTARDIGASVLLSAGTGTGQLDFTSGVVKANLAQILGTALTETAGQIAAAFKQFFNIASPTSTMNTITTVTTATNLTNAATSGDLTATMKTSVTTAATAATPTVSLSAAAITAIWDKLTSALTTVGSIGKLLVDNINATISSRLASASYTAPLDAAGTRSAVGLASANLDTQLTAIDDYIDTEVAAIKAKTDQLVFTVANQVDVNVVDWKGSAAPAMTGDAYARLGAPVGASISADVAGVQTSATAIKAKTDSLTFTTAGQVDANVKSVADTAVTGSGTDVDPWGP